MREGLHGVKPLSDKDRADIRKTIDEKILGGRRIAFRSTAIEPGAGGLTVRGELELAGTTASASKQPPHTRATVHAMQVRAGRRGLPSARQEAAAASYGAMRVMRWR